MGLTERHLFEDEEPELTENQLEDILWENNKIFERGYEKGFSDGKSALLREQESVEPLAIRKDIVDEVYDWIAECPACGMTWAMWHPDRMRFCPGCGKAVKWDADN